MKKLLSLMLGGAVLALALPSSATNRLELAAGRPVKPSLPLPAATVAPAKLDRGPQKVVTSADILIEEDFSGFTAGSETAPDDKVLASLDADPGTFIAPEYTKQAGWWGSYVYQAGGRCAIMCPDYQSVGYIATPLGDYSGEVTVTLRAKAYPCELTGSSLMIACYVGAPNRVEYADLEGAADECNVRLYPAQGWREITYTFRNHSANPDGSIVISATGFMLIDDVKVTSTGDFIAAPVMTGLTETRPDGFTINWAPVRKAFNYHINLFKKEYKGDGQPVKETVDFENGLLGADSDWTFATAATAPEAGIGAEGSKGLRIQNGDVVTSPVYDSLLKNVTMWINAFGEQENGRVRIEALGEEGWESFGRLYLSFFLAEDDPWPLDLQIDGEGAFADRYTAVRFTFYDMGENDYVVIDDINVEAAPVSELVRVENPDQEEGYEGYYYSNQSAEKPTCYTFNGLDPLGEYYYLVQSHYVNLYSENEPVYAFYVATPELEEPENVSADSYTVRWKSVPKATSYTVRNYGLTITEEAGETNMLYDEFDGVTPDFTMADNPWEPDPLMNMDEISLDEITDMPGWTGVSNTICVGMIGCTESMWSTAYLRTPELDLSNADETLVSMAVYGYVGSYLVIYDGENRYRIAYEPVDATVADPALGLGVINGVYSIPITGHKALRLTDENMSAFMVDGFAVVQDVPVGSLIRTALGKETTGPEATSKTWSNLSKSGFDKFGYDVTAHFAKDNEKTSSNPTQMAYINYTPTGLATGIATPAEVVETARYDLLGRRLNGAEPGVNIVVYSDGSVRKVIER